MENSREVILEILNKISDLDFQQKVWIEQSYWDKISNYGEAINTLEDYSFFEDVNNGLIRTIDEEQQKLLLSFSKTIIEFDENGNNKPVASNPRWMEASLMAKQLGSILGR